MLTIPILKTAYAHGLFPMADNAQPGAAIHWYHAARRAVIVPRNLHVPRRLARLVRQKKFTVRWNDDFHGVIKACAENRLAGESWLSPELIYAYTEWHKAGEAYSLSVFQEGACVGGIFGVHQGGAAATAESMFSRAPNASSIALVTLMAGFAHAGIDMVDLQYANPHTKKFNLTLMSHKAYVQRCHALHDKPCSLAGDYFSAEAAASFVQSLSHTS